MAACKCHCFDVRINLYQSLTITVVTYSLEADILESISCIVAISKGLLGA
jgi:hypothetical protein